MKTKQATVLRVEGMTCPSCVRHVEGALRPLDVGGIEVRLPEGLVIVEHDAEAVPVSELVVALREAGYESAPVTR